MYVCMYVCMYNMYVHALKYTLRMHGALCIASCVHGARVARNPITGTDHTCAQTVLELGAL